MVEFVLAYDAMLKQLAVHATEATANDVAGVEWTAVEVVTVEVGYHLLHGAGLGVDEPPELKLQWRQLDVDHSGFGHWLDHDRYQFTTRRD